MPEEPSTPLWKLILEQFQDQLVLILLGSAGISFVLAYFEEGDDKATAYVEPIVILLILIANAVVGVVQETNAEKAIEVRPIWVYYCWEYLTTHFGTCSQQALMEYSPDEAKVIRDGRAAKIHASEVVPGDLITVAVGDKIPADARVISISSASFTIDQALLTGESQSVSKSATIVEDAQAVKQDMINMLFSVSACRYDRALAVTHAISLCVRVPPSSTAKRRLSSPPLGPALQSEIFTSPSLPKLVKRRL